MFVYFRFAKENWKTEKDLSLVLCLLEMVEFTNNDYLRKFDYHSVWQLFAIINSKFHIIRKQNKYVYLSLLFIYCLFLCSFILFFDLQILNKNIIKNNSHIFALFSEKLWIRNIFISPQNDCERYDSGVAVSKLLISNYIIDYFRFGFSYCSSILQLKFLP
jgi:hypothetical protein